MEIVREKEQISISEGFKGLLSLVGRNTTFELLLKKEGDSDAKVTASVTLDVEKMMRK